MPMMHSSIFQPELMLMLFFPVEVQKGRKGSSGELTVLDSAGDSGHAARQRGVTAAESGKCQLHNEALIFCPYCDDVVCLCCS